MPIGPQGHWRPSDPIENAVMVAKIATGEITETLESPQESVLSQFDGMILIPEDEEPSQDADSVIERLVSS